MKKLTIFTPTYNRGNDECLGRCYKDLKSQTIKDFVWLIVDDGSTDGTEEYVRPWLSEGMLEIVYLKKQNGGMHTGYNKAFDICSTELICCLETDDQMMPDAVETILRESEGELYDACIGMISTCHRIGKNQVVGKAVPKGTASISYVDCYYKYKCLGDKFFVYKMSVIGDYRFPEKDGEKICGVSALLLSRHGKYKVIKEGIYNKSYLEDGFEQGGVMKYCVSPNGFAYDHQVKLQEVDGIKDNIKSAICYIGCSLLAGYSGGGHHEEIAQEGNDSTAFSGRSHFLHSAEIEQKEVPVKLQWILENRWPCLTVLTATYNRKQELHRLYESLCRQTNQDFQWLVIDDGSKDGTREWFEEKLLKQHSGFPIEYHYNINGGKHRALNYSHPYIRGRWLVIVDSDDYLTDDAVCIMNSTWRKYAKNPDIGGITFQRGDGGGEPMDSTLQGEYVSTFAEETNRGMRGDHCETIRTDLFLKFKFPEFEGEQFVGEGAMWYLATEGYRIVYVGKVVYICEYLEGGLTKSGRSLRIRNPYGGRWHAEAFLSKAFKMKIRIKNAILYNCYSAFIDESYSEVIHRVKYRLLVSVCWIPGRILCKYWGNIYL